VASHSGLKQAAVALFKIANDIRWMGSGPRNGLGELRLPINEPGSSIMPGKVNPTQAEALMMVCTQVMGNDAAITFASSNGNFELNVSKPLIIDNYLRSAHLLADACKSFTDHCVFGLEVDVAHCEQHLDNSLMMVTYLSPYIGYDNAAKIAHNAYENNTSIREEALASGLVTEEEFQQWTGLGRKK
jgi:fumarate hydratase class II